VDPQAAGLKQSNAIFLKTGCHWCVMLVGLILSTFWSFAGSLTAAFPSASCPVPGAKHFTWSLRACLLLLVSSGCLDAVLSWGRDLKHGSYRCVGSLLAAARVVGSFPARSLGGENS